MFRRTPLSRRLLFTLPYFLLNEVDSTCITQFAKTFFWEQKLLSPLLGGLGEGLQID